MAAPTLTEMSPDECWAHLVTAPVGRVGVSIRALPVVLPVNFAVVDHGIVFRTVGGTKFHAASAGAVLAFEADSYELSGRRGWSVMVQGKASEVTDATEVHRLSGVMSDSWALAGAADCYVRLEAVTITGRRFVR